MPQRPSQLLSARHARMNGLSCGSRSLARFSTASWDADDDDPRATRRNAADVGGACRAVFHRAPSIPTIRWCGEARREGAEATIADFTPAPMCIILSFAGAKGVGLVYAAD